MRIARTWSPGSRRVSPTAISASPPRITEISRAPVGQVDLADQAPRARRVLGELDLGDLELLAAQAQQLHELVVRELVLDQGHDRRGGADRRRDAEQVERLLVARVVDAGDRALDAVAVARDLADDDVVLVVAGDRHDEARATHAAALEDVQLGRVAVLHDVLELLLERVVAIGTLLDHRHLVPHREQVLGEVAADLAAARDQDVHG